MHALFSMMKLLSLIVCLCWMINNISALSPTGQPSRRPSALPSGKHVSKVHGYVVFMSDSIPLFLYFFSGQPTFVPSSQPSKQPTEQPSGSDLQMSLIFV